MNKLENTPQKNIEFLKKKIKGHEQFDELMGGKYHEAFQTGILYTELQIYKLCGDFSVVSKHRNKKTRRNLIFSYRLLLTMGMYFPKLTFRLYQIYKKR